LRITGRLSSTARWIRKRSVAGFGGGAAFAGARGAAGLSSTKRLDEAPSLASIERAKE
jgi:hypothetical protein